MKVSGTVDTLDILKISKEVRDTYLGIGEKQLAAVGMSHLLEADRPTANTLLPTVNKRPILKEISRNSMVTRDPVTMCGWVRAHFSEIYCAESPLVDKESTLFLNLPKLNDLQKDTLDSEFTFSELSIALKSLRKKRAPGIDGLTPEFYITFWEELKHFFSNIINEAFSKGTLPRTLRTACCLKMETRRTSITGGQ